MVRCFANVYEERYEHYVHYEHGEISCALYRKQKAIM